MSEWILINKDVETGEYCERMKVTGGWIIKATIINTNTAVSITFMPDSSAEWGF